MTSDDPQLQSLAQTANDLRGKIAHEWLQAMVEVRAILRPDQLAQAAQLQEQFRTLRQERLSLIGNQPWAPHTCRVEHRDSASDRMAVLASHAVLR